MATLGSNASGPVRADYHFHTQFSYDSRVPLEAALEAAQRSGLGVLCVTDHDTIEGAVKMAGFACPGVRIVVGCELTAEDGSHVIGLELRHMVSAKSVLGILEGIKRQGGLVLLPHLFRRKSGVFRNEMKRSPEFVREVLSHTDMVECHNGRDSYWHNQRAYRFAVERGLRAVAGSDGHTVAAIGSVFVEYEQSDFVHGSSARRICFPAQEPATENPVKRRALELYHRHERKLPPVVRSTYRGLKALLKPERQPAGNAPARAQYEFQGTSSPGERQGL